MAEQVNWSRQLPLVFGVVVLSFVAATGFTHFRLIAIDRAALDIAENSAPSIERLAVARGEMRRLQVLLREYIDRRAAGTSVGEEAIEETRVLLNRSIADYLKLPVFSGEQELWGAIIQARDAFSDSIAHCLSETDRGNFERAEALSRDEVSRSAEALATAITRDVEFNARQSHDLALQIRRLRGRSMYLAYGLDALCAVITIAGAVALHRAMRAHAALAERHQRLLEERASELEQFAGTIAHDIVSPLGAVGLALELAAGSGDGETRARYVARGSAALARVQRLVQGLLEFARAGAKPDPNTKTEVIATMTDLATELKAAAAQAGATLDFRADVASPVACNAGVLTSIVMNLTRNAIKYIGDGPIRRIEVRAFERADAVRVEVQDTGPGLPPGLEQHMFAPYVRGPRTRQSGIGLGLATVKRLVEGHGGNIGVHSVPGRGCTFWFELPKATAEGTASIAVAHAHGA